MQYAKLALETPIIAYIAHIKMKTHTKDNKAPNFLFDLDFELKAINRNKIHNTITYIILKNIGVMDITDIINIVNIGVKLEENVSLLSPKEFNKPFFI